MGSLESDEVVAAGAVPQTLDDGTQAIACDNAREELANSWTAAIGLGCSIAGVVYLLQLASATNSSLQVTASAIYGATLIILYTMSTLYHSTKNETWKSRFRLGDHASIYLLIAGSYTPCALVWLSGAWSWAIMTIVWLFAACGVLFKFRFRYQYQTLSTLIYIGMGWVGVCATRPLLESSPLPGLLWMLSSGCVYTFGVIFFVLDDLPYFHAIWHLFVLGGSACHFFGIVAYVIPMGV